MEELERQLFRCFVFEAEPDGHGLPLLGVRRASAIFSFGGLSNLAVSLTFWFSADGFVQCKPTLPGPAGCITIILYHLTGWCCPGT